MEPGVTSWWVGLSRDAFAERLKQESERILRLDLSPTAAEMAQHRRTRKQIAAAADKGA